MMKQRKFIILMTILVFISFALLSFIKIDENDNFSERVKIALRDSGNKLLLSNNDSTSLIPPIIKLDKDIFEVSFQKKISIIPDSLISIIAQSFKGLNLPNNYIVEVINGENGEVSYSYEIKKNQEENIIPCIGRNLPFNNYKVKILFTEQQSVLTLKTKYSILSFVMIGFFGLGLLYQKKEKSKIVQKDCSQLLKIGNYNFLKEERKLVKGNKTIELTTKECQLISIFCKRPNQIIKRDELIKEVWEDNGVFVGRSLDTFISKIRKKIKDDASIKIIAVHGIGYKLEVT